MIKLIRWLLGLCNHQWTVMAHWNLMQTGTNDKVGSRAYFKCAKCSRIRKEDYL